MTPWVVEIPPPEPRSTLPVGGSPADDRAYLSWRDGFLRSVVERDEARRWHQAVDRPLRLPARALDAHVFKSLGGVNPLFGPQDTPTYNHRLRFLGIAFRARRRAVIRAAWSFVEGAVTDDGL